MSSPQGIPISSLSLPQLSQLSQQLDEETKVLQRSILKLDEIKKKFSNSSEVLGVYKPENLDKEILVPLNNSIYVPGKLSNTEKVLVEIGTGYYADMDVEKAKAYLKRKVDYLTDQVKTLKGILEQKSQTKEVINDVIQVNLQSHLQGKKKQG